MKNTFKAFDLNGRSEFEYEEFIKALIGPMNKYRLDITQKVFDRLDITQQGLVDVSSDMFEFNVVGGDHS